MPICHLPKMPPRRAWIFGLIGSFNEDCIEGLRVPDNSPSDLSDIPYGIGAEDWDVLHDNTNSAYLGTSPAQEKAGKVSNPEGSRSTVGRKLTA